MKILLFGGSGQLGAEILVRARDLNFEIVAPVSSEVDVGDFNQVKFLVDTAAPDLIINAAAYTAVDKAETDRELAFRINADGAANVAKAAAQMKRRVIHVSTDYVFPGNSRVALTESAPVAPLNVYGESKLAGERKIQEILGDSALIVRTSSLHGKKGINFVNTMVKFFDERPVVKVVNDQWMSPTWAGWLAETILDLGRVNAGGVLHAAGSGVCSWFEFARAIFDWSKGPHKAILETTTTAEFARPAKRPVYSVLDCSRLEAILGRKAISWQDGLKSHLSDIGALRPDLKAF